MLLNSRPKSRQLLLTVAAFLLTLAAAAPLRAQSPEANFPTPVFAGELSGRIAPRDLGDPRRTRHFYTFRGAEGDLVVNLETAELLGDVDVFLATGFRPLVKFTLFGDAARLSKSFYLRKEETLILRVEARAVGDVEGTYRVTFGGSFLPAPPELANQAAPEAPTLSTTGPRGGGTRRVTATGARIEEPKVEPTPAAETAAAEPTPAPARTTGRRSNTNRRGRNTRPAPSRPRAGEGAAQPTTPESTEAKPAEETADTPTPTAKPAPTPTTSSRRRGTRTPRRGSGREGAGARAAEPPARPPADTQPAPAPAPTQRLIIVTRDGETLERDMSGVRRVTVENNQVVIVGLDGKVTRRPLADILRMSIEP
ncbi:MAG TPA: hypothetical protein VF591_23690 [Pyrinomonadaceae bacterium]|jgi:hypothetical protein